jgi:hypothetical protein
MSFLRTRRYDADMADTKGTNDQALWVIIRNGISAVGFAARRTWTRFRALRQMLGNIGRRGETDK